MNKTVLRRYTIEGVEPALLKSPKLLGKGNLTLSALINKLAEAEGQEPETYETWIEEQEFDEEGNYIDSRVVAEPTEMEWQHYSL